MRWEVPVALALALIFVAWVNGIQKESVALIGISNKMVSTDDNIRIIADAHHSVSLELASDVCEAQALATQSPSESNNILVQAAMANFEFNREQFARRLKEQVEAGNTIPETAVEPLELWEAQMIACQ